MDILENLEKIKTTIPENVQLIAVSKNQRLEKIMEAYDGGQRIFGENKPQELKEKYQLLPKDIIWHQVGHLQTNKVKLIAPFVNMIESVDSLKLLIEINKEASKKNRVIDCLLQIDIAKEETKFGLKLSQAKALLKDEQYQQMQNIRICGVMGIGSITENPKQTKKEFANLKSIFNTLKEGFFKEDNNFQHISMGMTHDYLIAIKEGSTMVRIGSGIFGVRNYF
ncbi:MAG: YggS family pyridoxal phosphate-dependent enzyme [Bacteroidales bacterium]|jgi:pyridoxal phosphate enzyme (YggS family)|nr:YggS family pyridoxal phosphate-dependent enzyme [Bacteroidales bacterium]